MFREKNNGHFFQTTETVGRICPNLESPEWFLQIPIPQNSRINLMFNGFCGYYNLRKRTCAVETILPEPGVMWGRFSDIPEPLFITDTPVKETDGYQWLESDVAPALLAVRDGHFCLVTKARIFSDAVQIADGYLGQDLEARLQAEFESRTGASELFERMTHHDSLAVISAECMMRAIRPPEGTIPTRWSQSSKKEDPHLDTNEIHALALAWRQLDPDTAEELFLGVLKLQNNSGAIPVTYAPQKTFSVLEAPKPMLAKTAEKIWETQENPRFLSEAIPLLRRHLQWLLHHFDPKRRGFHCWQNSSETLVPETYEPELATVDLTVLLLTEIEALNRLQKRSPQHAQLDPFFSEDRDTLESNLHTQFWNEQTSQYSNAYIRNNLIEFKGFPTLTPLLWRKLPELQKRVVLDQMRDSGSLPDGHNVLSWRTTVPDGREFPVLQQMLLLEILETHEPKGETARDFTRLMLQEFMEWHTRSIEKHGSLHLDPAMAAFILDLMQTHHYRDYSKNASPGFLSKLARKTRFNRLDAAIVAITILAVGTVRTIYNLRRQPPPFAVLDVEINRAYANRNADEVLRGGLQIIDHYPDQAGLARLLVGNILMVKNKPGEAEPFFRDVRKDYPDSPGPMISLGLAYQLQGRFAEADEVYGEFTYLFDEIFPKLVDTIQQYRYLMQEGIKTPPPKWIEIYGYQLMHEL